MLRKLILLAITLAIMFSYAGIAAAEDKIRVSISVKSEYAPKGYWSADFFNYDMGSTIKKVPQFTENPVIENGRMLVPLRQIAEALGYNVLWNPDTQTIELTGKNLKSEDTSIKMFVGMDKATVNSKTISLDVSPKIINGHTMIPLRFISEAMGYFVKYKSNTYGANIYITDYALLEDSDFDNARNDNVNYYLENDHYPHLRSNGQTDRGIRLGDSIEKVLQAYPRGLSYPSNYTGILSYETWIPYGAGSCALAFSFENGILLDVFWAV